MKTVKNLLDQLKRIRLLGNQGTIKTTPTDTLNRLMQSLIEGGIPCSIREGELVISDESDLLEDLPDSTLEMITNLEEDVTEQIRTI